MPHSRPNVAFAHRLGADHERCLHTWLVQEQMPQRAIRDDRDTALFYYRTPKGRRIHLVIEGGPTQQTIAIKICPEERVQEKDPELLLAFAKKLKRGRRPVQFLGLEPARMSLGSLDSKVRWALRSLAEAATIRHSDSSAQGGPHAQSNVRFAPESRASRFLRHSTPS
jgi:hypothetical protein